MKEYLKNISQELKNYSKSLDKTSILINKPWAVIDEEFQLQKLIFKKDKSLIMSRNGKVTEGKWDYFPEAKSLLIDRSNDKILCNEVFVNEGVLILKLDGTKKELFALANENIIGDLNIETYLNSLLKQQRINEGITINEEVNLILESGETLTISKPEGSWIQSGLAKAFIDKQIPENGLYLVKDSDTHYYVKKGKISSVVNEINIELNDGRKLRYFKQKWNDYIHPVVLLDNKILKEGEFPISDNKKLVVSPNSVRERHNNWFLSLFD